MPNTGVSFHDAVPSRSKKTAAEQELPPLEAVPSMSNTISTISDTASTVVTLAGEDSGTPQVHYLNIERFFQEYERFRNENYSSFCVDGVTIGIFEKILERRDSDRYKCRFQLFLPELELLLIKIPTTPHEIFHRKLDTYVAGHLNRSDCIWDQVGSTTYPGREARAQVGAAEGDTGGKPVKSRTGNDLWPTLVIEVGWSQTVSSLQRVMRWWFSASLHEVKVVLLVSFKKRGNQHDHDRVIIEKWIETRSPQSGVLTRARAILLGTLRPILDQRNIITYKGPPITADNRNSISLDDFYVTREDIVLEFSHLMLREPENESETDCVLTTTFLKQCAWRAWANS